MFAAGLPWLLLYLRRPGRRLLERMREGRLLWECLRHKMPQPLLMVLHFDQERRRSLLLLRLLMCYS